MKSSSIIATFDDILGTYKNPDYGKKALKKYSYWFPLKPSERLAGIVADLMGDGHIQGAPRFRLDYTSKSADELKRFNREIYLLFGINGRIRLCSTNQYHTKNLGINNKPLVRVLEFVGVPSGPKVFRKFSIPNWILSDEDLFSRFVNRLFSCEGSVDVYSHAIEIKMYKSLELVDDGLIFFKELKDHLLKYYGIRTTNPFLTQICSQRKDCRRTRGIRFKIKDKTSLARFQKFIGFDDIEKRKKLELIIQRF